MTHPTDPITTAVRLPTAAATAEHAATASPPPSNTLWRLLTSGYSHDYVNQLADTDPNKLVLIRRATKNWQQICAEAARQQAAPCTWR